MPYNVNSSIASAKYKPRRYPLPARPPVAYDEYGTPIPTNIAKHLTLAELPDAAFERYLDAQGRAEDRCFLEQLCEEHA